MIKKIKGKLYLYSEDGKKKLGGPYPATSEGKEKLRRRIAQVEYYKKHGK